MRFADVVRLGAECLEGVEDHLPRRDADFHAGEIRGRVDRARHRGDLAHAVVEACDRKQIHALRSHFLAHIGAERAVDRLVGLGGGPECEWHLLHFGHRHHRADDAAHQGEKLDFARDQHFQRRRVAGRELIVF